jgi:uncharacterized protein
MNDWLSTYLGRGALPRDLSGFEIEALDDDWLGQERRRQLGHRPERRYRLNQRDHVLTGRSTTYPIRSDTIRCKENGEISMSIEENVQIVKDFFAAMGGDKQGLLALAAEDIEWIIPGEDWPLAGTHRGHAGLADLLQKASETMETSFMERREFVAQGDRVLVVGFARGRIKATNRTWEDHWVFAITVRNGKVTNIREYVDTQALARASENSGIRNQNTRLS